MSDDEDDVWTPTEADRHDEMRRAAEVARGYVIEDRRIRWHDVATMAHDAVHARLRADGMGEHNADAVANAVHHFINRFDPETVQGLLRAAGLADPDPVVGTWIALAGSVASEGDEIRVIPARGGAGLADDTVSGHMRGPDGVLRVEDVPLALLGPFVPDPPGLVRGPSGHFVGFAHSAPDGAADPHAAAPGDVVAVAHVEDVDGYDFSGGVRGKYADRWAGALHQMPPGQPTFIDCEACGERGECADDAPVCKACRARGTVSANGLVLTVPKKPV